MNQSTISPPATLGILGGGQLGSMFTYSAKHMGYRVIVVDPDPHAPARQFADQHICLPYDDPQVISSLSRCDAITTEFENIPATLIAQLAKFCPVSPSSHCVSLAQNRIKEKNYINQAGLSTVPYQVIKNYQDIQKINLNLFPAILKTAELGYDGKGQILVNSYTDLQVAFEALGQVPCILEKKVQLKKEISIIVCRLDDQHIETFPIAENQHQNGILAYSLVPARLAENLAHQATQMAKQLACALNYCGVLAVEMFVLENNNLLINEIAPRPHNSGHYTLNACLTSQFEQQVRIMCGFAPAKTDLLSACCMANILGDVWGEKSSNPNWSALLEHPRTYLHLYGKKTPRKGRKMGHFTVLESNTELALEVAYSLHNQL